MNDVNNIFHELCVKLEGPYSQVVGFFESLVTNLEYYEISHNFYNYYADVEDKKKDAINRNLLQLRGKYLDEYNDKLSEYNKLQAKLQSLEKKQNATQEKRKLITQSLADNFYNIMVSRQKLDFISLMVSSIDKYNQIHEAINGEEFERALNKQKKQNLIILKKARRIAITSAITSFILAVLVISFVLRFYFMSEKFNSLFNNFIWVIILGALGSSLHAFISSFTTIYKLDEDD